MAALGNALGNHKLNVALARFKRACDRRSMVEVPDTLTSCGESLGLFRPWVSETGLIAAARLAIIASREIKRI